MISACFAVISITLFGLNSAFVGLDELVGIYTFLKIKVIFWRWWLHEETLTSMETFSLHKSFYIGKGFFKFLFFTLEWFF